MNSFIGQSLVFIASAVILVPIFKRLGFGSILGYLIAGMIVGPFGMKLIQDSESVMHFSELGVVLLLFIIGLEIQPRKLWSMRRHLVGLGGLQVTVTTLAFAAIGWAIGRELGLPPVAALVVGFGLSLSSTAFAVQSLTERNQFNTEFGRAAFAVLLMQDLVAIPALAVIPALGVDGRLPASGGAGFSWQTSLAAVAIIAGLIVGARYLIRPAFRLIASARAREIFTAATLLIVLGVAALMQSIGLSAALGTFIAGVLLADSEYRHELETDLEPFKSLLMGLFFIAVGMSVSLELIRAQPLQIGGMVIGYLAIKSFVIYGTGRAFRLTHENAKRMAITIAQGGEFAFVIFGLIAQSQLAPTHTLTLLTVVVTLSMALNPLVGMAVERLTCTPAPAKPEYDIIDSETPSVIIAGFGRFGQIFGRVLRAQGVPFVAIDHDPDHVEEVRKFGNKVYYGDASRLELLQTAGAGKAKFFILAIDDVEVSIQTAKTVKENFPNLTIFARARNRGHVFDLMAENVSYIKRETFDSSVNFVGDLLQAMGYAPALAQLIVTKFRQHDEIMLQEQFKVRDDDQTLISVSKQGVAQLAQTLHDDSVRSFVAPPS